MSEESQYVLVSNSDNATETLILTVEVLGYPINFYLIPFKKAIENGTFMGQKLLHPYVFTPIEEEYTFKKGKRTITRKKTGNVYGKECVAEGLESRIKHSKCFLKHDGMCGFIMYDPDLQKFIPYARYDIRRDKKTGEFGEPKPEWIPCESKPIIQEANHWPHFRCCYEDDKGYKWLIKAFNELIESGVLDGITTSFTCEFMGKKCNYCKTDPIEDLSTIIPHSCIRIDIPEELKTFDGFRSIFNTIPFIEGLVLYCDDNSVYKVRRDMFLDQDDKRMKWPNQEPQVFQNQFDGKVNDLCFGKGLGLSSLTKLV